MGAVFYVMAIMGCGDGSEQCRQVRLEPARYATVQQCRAELPAALARNTDLSFPTLSATCRASGPQVAQVERRQTRG